MKLSGQTTGNKVTSPKALRPALRLLLYAVELHRQRSRVWSLADFFFPRGPKILLSQPSTRSRSNTRGLQAVVIISFCLPFLYKRISFFYLHISPTLVYTPIIICTLLFVAFLLQRSEWTDIWGRIYSPSIIYVMILRKEQCDVSFSLPFSPFTRYTVPTPVCLIRHQVV